MELCNSFYEPPGSLTYPSGSLFEGFFVRAEDSFDLHGCPRLSGTRQGLSPVQVVYNINETVTGLVKTVRFPDYGLLTRNRNKLVAFSDVSIRNSSYNFPPAFFVLQGSPGSVL